MYVLVALYSKPNPIKRLIWANIRGQDNDVLGNKIITIYSTAMQALHGYKGIFVKRTHVRFCTPNARGGAYDVETDDGARGGGGGL